MQYYRGPQHTYVLQGLYIPKYGLATMAGTHLLAGEVIIIGLFALVTCAFVMGSPHLALPTNNVAHIHD